MELASVSPGIHALALVCALALLITTWTTRRRQRLSLPPGPFRLPIIGNALDIPSKDMGRILRGLSAKYGDVVYLEVFGQPMVLLGTHDAAKDLMEKRSSKYSDKPPSIMAYLTGWDWALPVHRYGPWWRRSRRMFHDCFNAGAITQYRPTQTEAIHRFLLRLLRDPQVFPNHIKHLIASSILRVTYGVDIDKESTPYLTIATEAMATFAATFVPGKYFVEVLPILRFIPWWVPGAQFKKDGKAWKPRVQRLTDTPWDACMAAIKIGNAPPSIVTNLMESASHLEEPARGEDTKIAKATSAAAYAGGSDTLYSTLMTFFLAMASHPDVQRRAQAELDAVVGPSRLPDFDDAPSLPYVTAIMKECMRWRIVLPLGLMHRSTEDDEYRGYYIPEGTFVIPNAWAYTRDLRHYPDPEEFKPERYLKDGEIDPDVLDPGDIAFGYGRRICPGRDFSEAVLQVIMSSILHAFEISPALDEQGVPLPLESKMSDGGVLSVPEPFECTIKVRSAETEALINAAN
ncbi:cytochrome P450 [Cubamyces lactineus]|nr:cytochrome P450 [Cubamyces lactineus]